AGRVSFELQGIDDTAPDGVVVFNHQDRFSHGQVPSRCRPASSWMGYALASTISNTPRWKVPPLGAFTSTRSMMSDSLMNRSVTLCGSPRKYNCVINC